MPTTKTETKTKTNTRALVGVGFAAVAMFAAAGFMLNSAWQKQKAINQGQITTPDQQQVAEVNPEAILGNETVIDVVEPLVDDMISSANTLNIEPFDSVTDSNGNIHFVYMSTPSVIDASQGTQGVGGEIKYGKWNQNSELITQTVTSYLSDENPYDNKQLNEDYPFVYGAGVQLALDSSENPIIITDNENNQERYNFYSKTNNTWTKGSYLEKEVAREAVNQAKTKFYNTRYDVAIDDNNTAHIIMGGELNKFCYQNISNYTSNNPSIGDLSCDNSLELSGENNFYILQNEIAISSNNIPYVSYSSHSEKLNGDTNNKYTLFGSFSIVDNEFNRETILPTTHLLDSYGICDIFRTKPLMNFINDTPLWTYGSCFNKDSFSSVTTTIDNFNNFSGEFDDKLFIGNEEFTLDLTSTNSKTHILTNSGTNNIIKLYSIENDHKGTEPSNYKEIPEIDRFNNFYRPNIMVSSEFSNPPLAFVSTNNNKSQVIFPSYDIDSQNSKINVWHSTVVSQGLNLFEDLALENVRKIKLKQSVMSGKGVILQIPKVGQEQPANSQQIKQQLEEIQGTINP